MADWSSTEHTFVGDAGKLKELHDVLAAHTTQDKYLGPVIEMEDFQRLTAPSEEPRDFYGAAIANIKYSEHGGAGVLFFEEINNWTEFSVVGHVLDAVGGADLGVRDVLRYGSSGSKHEDTKYRIIGSGKPYPVDVYFADAIRTVGSSCGDRMIFDVPSAYVGKPLRFTPGGSAAAMMLQVFCGTRGPVATSFTVDADRNVRMNMEFPRISVPLHRLTPQEQQVVKETYFKLPPLKVSPISIDVPKRDDVQKQKGPQVKELRSTPVKIDADAVQDKVPPITATLKRLVSEGRIESFGDFRDSLALVCRGGKYNYVREDGSFLSKTRWFDSATEFKNGRATVSFGGKAYEIDPSGTVTKVLEKQEEKKGGMKI